MLVDGKTIAAGVLKQVAEDVSSIGRPLRLSIITCAPNFETQKYLDMKKKKASSVGVGLNIIELPADISTEEVLNCIKQVIGDSDGIIVQLPLPVQIDRDKVLAGIPSGKDPDGFKYGQISDACLSPVVGAIDEISKLHNIEWQGKSVVVMGEGRLVGMPAAHYAQKKGGVVKVLTKETYSTDVLKLADIIITGIGQPHFIEADSVKDGVIIFDAGTSEDGGVLVGDVAPQVASKAKLLTPVPGGIGPITIAYLLKNLVLLVRQ